MCLDRLAVVSVVVIADLSLLSGNLTMLPMFIASYCFVFECRNLGDGHGDESGRPGHRPQRFRWSQVLSSKHSYCCGTL